MWESVPNYSNAVYFAPHSLHPMAVPRRAARCLTSPSRMHIRSYADTPTWVATRHTIRVAPWDGFKSMPHVYATARELEKRFGPVNLIKVPRVGRLLTWRMAFHSPSLQPFYSRTRKPTRTEGTHG